MKLSREAQIGLMVLVAAVALFFGFNYLKGHSIFQRYNTYYAVFENADNLSTSDKVLYRGYKVGQIVELSFNPRTGQVRVEFEVLREIPLPIDSRATITNLDLLGTKGLWVVPGTSEQLAVDGDTLRDSLATGAFDKVLQEVRPVRDNLDKLLQQLHETASHLNRLLAASGEVPQAVGAIRGLARTAEAELPLMTAQLRQTLYQLDTTLVMLQPSLQKMLGSVNGLTDSLQHALPPLVSQLDSASAQLTTLMASLNRGEGTLGRLVRDSTLYRDLDQATVSLRQLLDELRLHPERFVHFSLFGRRSK